MRIAFHAPMKPPTSIRPSGDRTIARLLMEALTVAGADVRLASGLRTWSDRPEAARLTALEEQATAEADRLAAAFAGGDWRPDLWFTYHNHYKAPDLLGVQAARRLAIPYAIAEASYAARRSIGPWAEWTAQARAAIEAADVIFSFTRRDEAGLVGLVPAARLVRLAPFIGEQAIAPAVNASPTDCLATKHGGPVRLVVVAMMREGAKARSYRLLADALDRLRDLDWSLDVVGDGAAAPWLRERLQAVCGPRVRFHGRLEGARLRAVLDAGDVFVWPGIEEAFGMAFLEAQTRGLPVAACATAGVGEVVADGVSGLLAADRTAAAYAATLVRLIEDRDLRLRLGSEARRQVRAHHSLAAAARVLGRRLAPLVGGK